MDKIQQFVKAIRRNERAVAGNVFNEIMAEKTKERLEQVKIRVASEIYEKGSK